MSAVPFSIKVSVPCLNVRTFCAVPKDLLLRQVGDDGHESVDESFEAALVVDDRLLLQLLFLLLVPVRLRIDLELPQDLLLACEALNKELKRVAS